MNLIRIAIHLVFIDLKMISWDTHIQHNLPIFVVSDRPAISIELQDGEIIFWPFHSLRMFTMFTPEMFMSCYINMLHKVKLL